MELSLKSGAHNLVNGRNCGSCAENFSAHVRISSVCGKLQVAMHTHAYPIDALNAILGCAGTVTVIFAVSVPGTGMRFFPLFSDCADAFAIGTMMRKEDKDGCCCDLIFRC